MSIQKVQHTIVRAVIIKDDHLLVCIGKNNKYVFLPGGHLEPGESLKYALERELQEELSMHLKVGRFLGCFESSLEALVCNELKHMCHTHEINFLFEVASDENFTIKKVPESAESHTKFKWIPLVSAGNKDNFLPTALFDVLPVWLAYDYGQALKSDI